MKLKDISDMTQFLAYRCYCPGEIYDRTGFFFEIFKEDDDCKLLVEGSYKDDKVTAVVCKNQILCFWFNEDSTIMDATRYDATPNNTEEIIKVLTGKKTAIDPDDFKPGQTEANLKEIFSIADAIMM